MDAVKVLGRSGSGGLCAAALVAAAAGAPAQQGLAAPAELRLELRYGEAPTLTLAWAFEGGGPDVAFEVERRFDELEEIHPVGPGTYAFSTPAPGDVTAIAFRVRAVVGNAVSAWSEPFAFELLAGAWQVWPMGDESREVMHAYGSPLIWGWQQYFHGGVDLLGCGTPVRASRGGLLLEPEPDELRVRVNVDSSEWLEVYEHVDPTTIWGLGDWIAPGETLGHVACDFVPPARQHLHWARHEGNPLAGFEDPASRDPHGAPPTVRDLDGDARAFTVVRDEETDELVPGASAPVAHGAVDLLVEAYDVMSTQGEFAVPPLAISYWIESLVLHGQDVASAAAPLEFIRMETLANKPWVHEILVPAKPVGADWAHTATGWPTTLTWRVTNTSPGEDDMGSWRTASRSGADDPAELAGDVQEARFPDGPYRVHVLVEDLVQQHVEPLDVVVDNWRPYVREVTLRSGGGLARVSGWRWSAAAQALQWFSVTLDGGPGCVSRAATLELEVRFSEPMSFALALVPCLDQQFLFLGPVDANGVVWKAAIPSEVLGAAPAGDCELMILGVDRAGNITSGLDATSHLGPGHHGRGEDGALGGTAGLDVLHDFCLD